MMCEECGLRPATIRLLTIVNGEKRERNLCAVCMLKIKKQFPNLDLSGLSGLLSGFIESTNKLGFSSEPSLDLTCSRCGTTYDAFRKTGMLGCAQCYQDFREPMEALLKRVHGQTQHTGRVPGGPSGGISVKMQIERLRQDLAKAVVAEEYEDAAVIRDKIKSLKAELVEKQPGGEDEANG